MSRRSLATLALLVIALGTAQSVQAEITTTRIATDLRRPVRMVSPLNDDRLFVVEQAGFITILNPDGSEIGQFLDIDAKVPNISGNDERGLLGLAFSPDYANDGIFYVNYTNLQSNTVVARYLVSGDPDVADPGSEEIFLTISQPFANHNGGHMEFGHDGMLYIGMGDGGSANDPGNRAQNDGTLLGKMLRIDVSGGYGSGYSVPADNPNVGGAGRDEIWAKGLRNPWVFSFDSATGDMYIADVGQNVYEEVDVQPAASDGGENYGWRLMEGNHCFNPPTDCNDGSLTLPIHEYTHGGNPFRCSISGGYVYRGSIDAIEGHYFFADWCSNQIWSLIWDGANGISELNDWTNAFVPDVGTIRNISALGRDAAGELYIIDRGTSSANGELFKIIDETVGVEEQSSLPPSIIHAAPNPFSRTTELTLDVADDQAVTVTVFDAQGRLVRELVRNDIIEGPVAWDGTDTQGRRVPGGVYLVRAEREKRISQLRVTVVR